MNLFIFVLYLVKTSNNFSGIQYEYRVRYEVSTHKSPVASSVNCHVTFIVTRKGLFILSKQMFKVLPISSQLLTQVPLVNCLVHDRLQLRTRPCRRRFRSRSVTPA